MNLEKLADWPSAQVIKRLIFFSIILYAIQFPIMVYYWALSTFPTNFYVHQLSFSGPYYKSLLKSMSAEQINYYRIAIILDDFYALSYGIFYFSIVLYLGRKYEEVSGWRKSGYLVAILGVIAAICDNIENGFILLMLTDPRGFPDIWAITHSYFALIKIIFIWTCIVWIIIADINLYIKKIHNFKPFLVVLISLLTMPFIIIYTLIAWP